MIGQTNSLIGGRKTLVFAKPLPLQTLHKDDKVFIKRVDLDAEQSYTASLTDESATNNSYIEPFFINNAVAVCPASHQNFSLQYIKWVTGWATSIGAFSVNTLAYAMFRTLTRGDFLVVGGNHFYLTGATAADALSHNNFYYAGKFGNYDYAVSSVNGSVCLYDWTNKSAGNVVFSRSLNYATHGTDEAAELLFVQDTDMVFYLFGMEDNSFAQLGYTTLAGFVTGYTGLDNGNYIFAVEQHGATYNKHYLSTTDTDYVAGSGDCSLKIYISDGAGGMTAIGASSPLYRFTQMNKAIAHFDARINVLFIGTTSEIHFFYWDATDGSWTEIMIDGLQLPTNPDGNHIYNAALSPNMRNLLVYCGNTGTGGRNVKIYDLLNASAQSWQVISEANLSTVPNAVWSAVATGNVDDDGNVELKVAMPDELSVAVNITPTPDHFNF